MFLRQITIFIAFGGWEQVLFFYGQGLVTQVPGPSGPIPSLSAPVPSPGGPGVAVETPEFRPTTDQISSIVTLSKLFVKLREGASNRYRSWVSHGNVL